jgi:1-acyl-sn-glycerol-3-phosphate acyltransferase
LPLVLRRRLTYVAKAEYFDHWRTAWFFRAAGQIPMRREGGDASQRALDTARDVLAAGHLLGIYPEGTRAPDQRLHRGHTGAARLALRCDVPIIPVGIVGTRAVQPPGRRMMRPFHAVTVRFGPPVTSVHNGRTLSPGARSQPVAEGHDGRAEGHDGRAEGHDGRAEGHDGRAEGHDGGWVDPDPDELRGLTDSLMSEIARLSGQDYVDQYASRARAG